MTPPRARRRARSTYGRGTIEQRGTQFWIRYYQVVDGEGRRWRDGPFNTEKEAEAHRDRSTRLEGHQATDLSQYLAAWQVRASAEARSEQRVSAAKNYRIHIQNHLIPHLTGIRLGELVPSDLNAVWRAMLDDGYSRKTVYNVRSTLSKALRAAVADRIIASNPVRDSDLPTRHRGTAKAKAPGRKAILDDDQYANLIRWLETTRSMWASPSIVVAETGMRRGEALAISWRNIDLKARTLTIESQIVYDTETRQCLVLPVKTGAGNRTIALTDRTVELLQRRRSDEASSLVHLHGLVFNDRAGHGPLNPESFTQWIRKVARPALGLPKEITLHSLRHTHASHLLDDGEPESVVAERLGHSSPLVTRGLYSHSTAAGDRAAAERWSRRHGSK